MILKHLVYAFALSLLLTTAHASVTKTLDERQVLEIVISQDGLTRIKVEDDRILHVFGNAGEYVLETDTHQGQIFIRPLPLGGIGSALKPISLTLTTELGHTQDLRLIPKDQAPEALILKLNTELTQEIEREKIASAPLFREEVEGLIQACQEGRIPLGYKEVPIPLSSHEPYVLLREIQGEKLRGLTYRVHNATQETVSLSEVAFAENLFLKPRVLVALVISKKTLTPGEGTDVYVVARAH